MSILPSGYMGDVAIISPLYLYTILPIALLCVKGEYKNLGYSFVTLISETILVIESHLGVSKSMGSIP